MLWQGSTLWKAGLTALALLGLGTGCVSGDGDDEASVEAQWDVAYVGGQRISCDDAGTAWVRLDLKSRKNVGSFSYDFPCASGVGLTEEVPGGAYDVTLSLLDGKMRPVSQIAGAYEVRRRGRTVLDLIQFQVLAWEVSWTLSLEQGGMPPRLATCADVGARTVELVTQLGSEEQERYPFDCAVGLGVTQAVRKGSYGYQVRVLDAAGQPLMATAIGSKVLSNQIGVLVEKFAFK